MERFTEWIDDAKTEVSVLNYKMRDAMLRLAAYEDIELMPEEIEKLKDRDKVMKMYKPNPNIYCCPACGEKLAPMWDFCPWCGQHLMD